MLCFSQTKSSTTQSNNNKNLNAIKKLDNKEYKLAWEKKTLKDLIMYD